MITRLSLSSLLLLTLLPLKGLASTILVSVPDQKMALLDDHGKTVAEYPVSTSRYGLGDRFGSYATPKGWMEVAQKIGAQAPMGAVFKSRRFTGEILKPNAPGRDPIVTRILWLRGTEPETRNAFSRKIYIHGTPQEKLIGKPASYGCIRMRSRDVVDIFNRTPVGTRVNVSKEPLRKAIAQIRSPEKTPLLVPARVREKSDQERTPPANPGTPTRTLAGSKSGKVENHL